MIAGRLLSICYKAVICLSREILLVLPFPVSANRYWRNVKGRMIKSEKARLYQNDIKNRFKIETFADCAIELKIDLYRPKKMGDLDNYLKVTIDSLKGICFNDDKQVRKITAEMFDDKDYPRCEVLIQEYVSKWQRAKRLIPKSEPNEIM